MVANYLNKITKNQILGWNDNLSITFSQWYKNTVTQEHGRPLLTVYRTMLTFFSAAMSWALSRCSLGKVLNMSSKSFISRTSFWASFSCFRRSFITCNLTEKRFMKIRIDLFSGSFYWQKGESFLIFNLCLSLSVSVTSVLESTESKF